jgi:hypothetical protein
VSGDAADVELRKERRVPQERANLPRPGCHGQQAPIRGDRPSQHKRVTHLHTVAQHQEIHRLERPDGEGVRRKVELISGLLPAVIITMTARSRSDSSWTMPADGIM